MTYSLPNNRLIGHSASGTEVFYTFCEDSKAELTPPCGIPRVGGPGDRCLGALPAEGGSRIGSWCGSTDADADSVKTFHAGTRLADGSLVFTYSSHLPPSMSIPINGKLYIQRPGEHHWTPLIEYPFHPDGSPAPSRVVPAGPGRVVTSGGATGTELVTIGSDNSVTRRQVGALSGVDPVTGFGVRVVDGMIRRVDLESGAETDLLPIPSDATWDDSTTTGAAIGGGVVVITQSIPGGASRVVAIRPGSAPVVVLEGVDVPGTVSVAPDGRSVVVQAQGDLYRYPIP